MTVKQLIEELQKQNPNAEIWTWDAYGDTETPEVYVCKMRDGTVLVSYVENYSDTYGEH